ncbi:MAG TPA: HAD-IIIA family hydrolase [Candidatus Nanoarchaeia archaeon]|nr:HAD-IIIA family hydrolase [Candidatus Nanoarchaeia archaeon]
MNQDLHKAVFLDKDGTLVDNSQYPYVIPTDKLLAAEVVEGLLYLQQKGYKLFIVSNQSWISKRRLSQQQVEEVFQNLIATLGTHNVIISGYYYCPHRKTDNCDCRKPKTKLIELAAREHFIDLSQSFFIGDMDLDVATGKNSGMKTVLVLTGKGREYNSNLKPDFVIKNINHIKGVM